MMLFILLSGCLGGADAEAPPPTGDTDTGDTDTGDTGCEPGTEVCNRVDDDCDGVVDPPGSAGCVDGWLDEDGDEVGVGEPLCVCADATEGYTAPVDGDCDDADPWRAESCSDPEDASTADAAALIVGETSRMSLGDVHEGGPLTSSSTLGGTGAWLYIAADGYDYITPVPAEGQVGAASSAVATIGVKVVAIGDIDGDGVDDLVTTGASRIDYASSTPSRDWYFYYYDVGLVSGPIAGEITPSDPAIQRESSCSNYVNLSFVMGGDLDNDERGDLLYEEWCDRGIVRLKEDGTSESILVASMGALTALGDADGDGSDDLLFDEYVFLGPDIRERTLADADIVLDTLGDVTPAGDLDGDGDLDFVAHARYREWILDELAPGGFADLAVATIGADEYDDAPFHAAGDLDGDGRDDLAIAMEGMNVFYGPLEGRRGISTADLHISDAYADYGFGRTAVHVATPDGPRLAVASEGSSAGAAYGGAIYLFDLGRP